VSASATLRTTIVAALSTRPCTTFALAELAGMEWGPNTRKKIQKAIDALRRRRFRIVNINAYIMGSHDGALYVMTYSPDSGPVWVTLPPRRCGTPGCITYLARDHIINGSGCCSACWERRVHAGCLEILGEFGQQEMAV